MVINFNSKKYITLESVFERISVAEGNELWDIAKVVVARYKECFPQWKVEFLALPKDRNEQIEYLERIVEVLRSHPDL